MTEDIARMIVVPIEGISTIIAVAGAAAVVLDTLRIKEAEDINEKVLEVAVNIGQFHSHNGRGTGLFFIRIHSSGKFPHTMDNA